MGLRVGLAAVVAGVSLLGTGAPGAWAAPSPVTPGWECIPTTAGHAVLSGGTGPTPACGASSTAVLAPTYTGTGVGSQPTVQFAAVNVQILNGAGATATDNGTGNLVLGYDEGTGNQTGSHNLVLGTGQAFTGYGDLVAGTSNSATSNYDVVAGSSNKTAASASSLLGGFKNTVSTAGSALLGGCGNLAGSGTLAAPPSACTDNVNRPGQYASITGGSGNQTTGVSSSIAGGQSNLATDPLASVAGGCDNLAGAGSHPNAACSPAAEAVLGGDNNTADGPLSTVGGGAANRASGQDASVSGGSSSTASGSISSVSGGSGNTASNDVSSVSGGFLNIASGVDASATGGESNTASGEFASATGGQNNLASDVLASIHGGCDNLAGPGAQPTASCDTSGAETILGGSTNLASGLQSVIDGGFLNTVSGPAAEIAGGRSNAVSATEAAIAGGEYNIGGDPFSFIGGGCDDRTGTGARNTNSCDAGGEGDVGGAFVSNAITDGTSGVLTEGGSDQASGAIALAAFAPGHCSDLTFLWSGLEPGDIPQLAFTTKLPPAGLVFEPLAVQTAGRAKVRVCNASNATTVTVSNLPVKLLSFK